MNFFKIYGTWLYATALLVFGILHFVYANFVASLIPVWIPWHLFFTYATGAAFIAAAPSLIINRATHLACLLLAIMLFCFILFIHAPLLISGRGNLQNYTRAAQDTGILGTTLMLTRYYRFNFIGNALLAMALLYSGLQHFVHLGFMTAMTPGYFPGIPVWDYCTGLLMIIASLLMLCGRYDGLQAFIFNCYFLLIVLLYQLPLIILKVTNGQQWAALMLDISLTAGVFIASAGQFAIEPTGTKSFYSEG